MKHAIGTY